MADNLAHPYNHRQVVTIDVLPDDVLLTIFDFCVVGYLTLNFTAEVFGKPELKRTIEWWQSLVHVCRRWRGLVFESPRRLNLQHFYIPGTSKSLDVWPALPLLIQGEVSDTSVDNVIAKLEHGYRICQSSLLCHTSSQIEKLWTAMQVPFPELAVLYLSYMDEEDMPYTPVVPDSFLGGSAPRLRLFALDSISSPGLPKLLLSATNLVMLLLYNIPHSGYISPEVMATCLPVLTHLEDLFFHFDSPQSSSPDQESRRPPPPTRSVLPALTNFSFRGVNEYLEELVARIDTPRLSLLWTTFFNDTDFDTPELIQYMSRTLTFAFEASIEAHVVFGSSTAWVILQSQASYFEEVKIEIIREELNQQLSSLAQICTSFMSLFSMTKDLYIYEDLQSQSDWKDSIENTNWLELLLPFTAVEDLYLSKRIAPRITPALQDLTGERTAEVLPTLQNIFLEGLEPLEPVDESFAQFISARQLANGPVAISVWERD